MTRPPPRSTLFPTRRSSDLYIPALKLYSEKLSEQKSPYMAVDYLLKELSEQPSTAGFELMTKLVVEHELDRKSTRLNSSHVRISYAVFCLKKKKNKTTI